MLCKISFTINGEPITLEVDPKMTLLRLIRDKLRLTGTKEGCGRGDCGACTVLVNGYAVNSCLILAPQVNGKDILTIEGLAKDGKLDPLQEAFIKYGAVQCGFCTPGMIMSAKGLLLHNPKPTREEIKKAIAGNLCRCTGYLKIIEAIEAVAEGKL